ncbi:hypothetical protein [Sphingosinicella rhizophila]|uniref:Uncharacterized protein n=1 Tax=Sphingosinicella rhizophila TaxID=3050082 RepID=A0ABU3Q950_9SPHN|nr:hypothetical protein [Sphingosinicella sp. GR2756]MDT9599822.1 hypothetical protein [Sphingosinicella sp. GR2756]
MSIEALILGAFMLALLLSLFTRVHPATYGCLVPMVTGLIIAASLLIWRYGTSTAVLEIPAVMFWTSVGSIPGAFLAGWIRTLNGEDFG